MQRAAPTRLTKDATPSPRTLIEGSLEDLAIAKDASRVHGRHARDGWTAGGMRVLQRKIPKAISLRNRAQAGLPYQPCRASDRALSRNR